MKPTLIISFAVGLALGIALSGGWLMMAVAENQRRLEKTWWS